MVETTRQTVEGAVLICIIKIRAARGGLKNWHTSLFIIFFLFQAMDQGQ